MIERSWRGGLQVGAAADAEVDRWGAAELDVRGLEAPAGGAVGVAGGGVMRSGSQARLGWIDRRAVMLAVALDGAGAAVPGPLALEAVGWATAEFVGDVAGRVDDHSAHPFLAMDDTAACEFVLDCGQAGRVVVVIGQPAVGISVAVDDGCALDTERIDTLLPGLGRALVALASEPE